MKNRPASPFIVSAMTLLATSLGIADATAQDRRNPDRQGDSTLAASKGDRLAPRAAESRQIKIGAATQPQARQIKIDGIDAGGPQSRQIKIDGLDNRRPQSRQLKRGPAGDGG